MSIATSSGHHQWHWPVPRRLLAWNATPAVASGFLPWMCGTLSTAWSCPTTCLTAWPCPVAQLGSSKNASSKAGRSTVTITCGNAVSAAPWGSAGQSTWLSKPRRRRWWRPSVSQRASFSTTGSWILVSSTGPDPSSTSTTSVSLARIVGKRTSSWVASVADARTLPGYKMLRHLGDRAGW